MRGNVLPEDKRIEVGKKVQFEAAAFCMCLVGVIAALTVIELSRMAVPQTAPVQAVLLDAENGAAEFTRWRAGRENGEEGICSVGIVFWAETVPDDSSRHDCVDVRWSR